MIARFKLLTGLVIVALMLAADWPREIAGGGMGSSLDFTPFDPGRLPNPHFSARQAAC